MGCFALCVWRGPEHAPVCTAGCSAGQEPVPECYCPVILQSVMSTTVHFLPSLWTIKFITSGRKGICVITSAATFLLILEWGGGWTVKWQAISTTPLEVSCLNSCLFYTAVLILQTLDLDFCVFVASVALSLCPLKWVQLPRNVKSLLRRDHLATLSLVSGGLAPCFTQSCSPRCTFVNLSRLCPASRPGGVAARGLL